MALDGYVGIGAIGKSLVVGAACDVELGFPSDSDEVL
jgi:hypothetical protein